MTVVNFPGEREPASFMWAILALLLPFSGISKACIHIAFAIPGTDDPLRRALYAGALCEVVHGDDNFILIMRKIQGHASLPAGYNLRTIKRDITFPKFEASFNKISSSQSHLGSVIAICQLLFSCLTLYHTRGNQIQLYGYAAFGFTVVPYAVMSFVNLVANLLTPHYPTMYMVRTPLMAEAEEAGGRFEGVIATVDSDRDDRFQPIRRYFILACVLAILALIAPYIILKTLTGFESGDSTEAQRGWTMGWLVIGQFYGVLATLVSLQIWDDNKPIAMQFDEGPQYERMLCGFILFCGTVVPSVAAIGGFVVVGQMLVVHGDCSSTAL